MYESYLAEYLPLQFTDYQSSLSEMPETVDNTLEAVTSCLAEVAQPRASASGA